jgi:hypothetical protein
VLPLSDSLVDPQNGCMEQLLALNKNNDAFLTGLDQASQQRSEMGALHDRMTNTETVSIAAAEDAFPEPPL